MSHDKIVTVYSIVHNKTKIKRIEDLEFASRNLNNAMTF